MATIKNKFFNESYKKNMIYQIPLRFSLPNFSIRNKFQTIVRQSNSIVDLGCGHGNTLHQFRRINSNTKLTGIDFSKIALKEAKVILKNDKVKLINKNLELKQLKISEYDLVYCSQVIEHFKDYSSFINRIYKSLQNKGYLLLTTTYKTKNAFYFYKNKLGQTSLSPDHINEITNTKELLSILKKSGFKIIEYKLTLFKYPIFDILIKTLTRYKKNRIIYLCINNPITMFLRYVFVVPIFGFYNFQILAKKGSCL